MKITDADIQQATAEAAAKGVTLESTKADLLADGYTAAGAENNAPIVLRDYIAAIANNAAARRNNVTTATAPRERMGCDSCGDHVPCTLTPRGWMCDSCKRGE